MYIFYGMKHKQHTLLKILKKEQKIRSQASITIYFPTFPEYINKTSPLNNLKSDVKVNNLVSTQHVFEDPISGITINNRKIS